MDNKPQPFAELIEVLQAFAELSTQRMYALGPLPIQLSEMLAWFEISGVFDTEVRREWLTYFIALDHVWLKYQAEQKNANSVSSN